MSTNAHPYRRRGLSLPEIMIGLTITVLLLTATAAAFNASASAVSMNDKFFRASQSARVSLNQLMVEIRRCDAVSVNSTYIDIIRPTEEMTPGEVFRRIAYDATNQKLTVQVFQAGNVGGPVRTLANNVTAITFGPADMVKDANQAWVVVRVPVAVTVTVGNNVITLNGAAAPRRAQKS